MDGRFDSIRTGSADCPDTVGAAEAAPRERGGTGSHEDGHETLEEGRRRVRVGAGGVVGVDRRGGRVRAHVRRRQSGLIF